MATTATTAAPTNETDAEFRAWAQFIHDVFANGSWVQTSDTGQINLTTATKPGAANTKVGYEIWRMDDALQTDHPVFLKLAYGSGSSTFFPAMWFIIGTGTDGAGAMIDPNDGDRPAYLADFYTQTAAPIFSRSNSATAHECFGSATTSRAVFLAFEGKPFITVTDFFCSTFTPTNDNTSVGNFAFMFSIERARDINGDLSGDHIQVMWAGTATNNGGAITGHLYLKTSNSWVPTSSMFGTITARAPGIGSILDQRLDTMLPASGVASAFGIIPFEQNGKPAWPGINLVVSPSSLFKFSQVVKSNCNPPPAPGEGSDILTYITNRTAGVTSYGTARTYRTCAGLRGGSFASNTADAGAFIWMLYE